jgi:uncharacterized protein YyaL (SSP411 family)
MLCNMLPGASNPRQIVIAGDLSNPETQALLAAARAPYLGDALILHACHEAKAAGLGGKFASIADMKPIKGKAAAYVCENFSCKAPVTDAKALDVLLRSGNK